MKIRLWKLGSLEHKIYPTDAAMENLREMLSTSAETLDIIWGPDISVQEINVDLGDLDIVLGAYKVDSVIQDIPPPAKSDNVDTLPPENLKE